MRLLRIWESTFLVLLCLLGTYIRRLVFSSRAAAPCFCVWFIMQNIRGYREISHMECVIFLIVQVWRDFQGEYSADCIRARGDWGFGVYG